MLTVVDRLAKGTMAVMHEVALLRTEVLALRKANEGLIKRRRAKKNKSAAWRVPYCTRDTEFTGLEGCGVCGKPGHNARTCK